MCIPITASAVVNRTRPLPLAFRFADHRCADQQWFWFPLRLFRCADRLWNRCTAATVLPFIQACSVGPGAHPKHSAAQTLAHHVGCEPHRLLQTECCMESRALHSCGCSAAHDRSTMAAMKVYSAREALPEPVQPRKHYCNSTCRAECLSRAQAKGSPRRHLKRGGSALKEIRSTNACGWSQLGTGQFRRHQRSAPIPHRTDSRSSSFAKLPGRDRIGLCFRRLLGTRMPRFSRRSMRRGRFAAIPLPLNSQMTFICSMGRCIACYGSARADSSPPKQEWLSARTPLLIWGHRNPSVGARLPFVNRPLREGATADSRVTTDTESGGKLSRMKRRRA